MKILFFMILFLYSEISFADTYPASTVYSLYAGDFDNAADACVSAIPVFQASQPSIVSAHIISGLTCGFFDNVGDQRNSAGVQTRIDCLYGGTVSGNQCVNAPSCPTGQTRNSTTGACSVNCPSAGTKQIIAINDGSESVADNGEMVLTIDGNAANNTVLDGCGYTYTASDFDVTSGCKASPTPDSNGKRLVYCNYNATSKGTSETTPSNAKLPANLASDSLPVSSTENGNCISDAKGNKLCKTISVNGVKCGTVNGVKVCPVTGTGISGTGTINGKNYVQSQKNCGFVNGQPVCASSSSSSSTTKGCVSNNGVRGCTNTDVKEDIIVTTVTNPDGSITRTSTTSNNVIGDTDTVSTTVTNPDGSSVTTKTPGTDSFGKEGIPSTDGTGSISIPYTSSGSIFPATISPFYVTKYPLGLSGVWAAHQTQFSNSPFMTSLNGLSTGAPGSGNCPSWSFSWGTYGTHVIAPDCAIWVYIRLFIMISAIFVARRIIFGG